MKILFSVYLDFFEIHTWALKSPINSMLPHAAFVDTKIHFDHVYKNI